MQLSVLKHRIILNHHQHACHAAEPSDKPAQGSPITTHMLDTSMGRPAPDVPVALHRQCAGSRGAWDQVAAGRTNSDGRVPNLMPPSNRMPAGTYRC